MNHWVGTFTGKRLHLLDPKVEEIDIEDIAYSLSLQCRFTGHCHTFYSVAEHSVRVSKLVSQKDTMGALLHDAAEAYIGDISRPVKSCVPELKVMERKIQDVILQKFGVLDCDKHAIERADNILLAAEARDLMDNTTDWDLPEEPYNEKIYPLESGPARLQFLAFFHWLTMVQE